MTGRTRLRRLGASLAGAALVVTFAGCTVGTTTIPAGPGTGQFVACSPTQGGSWVPGPGATHLRFEVLKSDSTQPLAAALWGSGNEGSAIFGEVWDGTKSTGPQEVQMPIPSGLLILA